MGSILDPSAVPLHVLGLFLALLRGLSHALVELLDAVRTGRELLGERGHGILAAAGAAGAGAGAAGAAAAGAGAGAAGAGASSSLSPQAANKAKAHTISTPATIFIFFIKTLHSPKIF